MLVFIFSKWLLIIIIQAPGEWQEKHSQLLTIQFRPSIKTVVCEIVATAHFIVCLGVHWGNFWSNINFGMYSSFISKQFILKLGCANSEETSRMFLSLGGEWWVTWQKPGKVCDTIFLCHPTWSWDLSTVVYVYLNFSLTRTSTKGFGYVIKTQHTQLIIFTSALLHAL